MKKKITLGVFLTLVLFSNFISYAQKSDSPVQLGQQLGAKGRAESITRMQKENQSNKACSSTGSRSNAVTTSQNYNNKIVGAWTIRFGGRTDEYTELIFKYHPSGTYDMLVYTELGYSTTRSGNWQIKPDADNAVRLYTQLNMIDSVVKLVRCILIENDKLILTNLKGENEIFHRQRVEKKDNGISCPLCAGKGKQFCTRCGGNGYYYVNGIKYDCDGVTGPNCVSGEVQCTMCKGKGRIRN
ncbi:MAG: hypothetical protein JNL70_26645 [Saprospiraceae bacterium]|nr:hypothetical protein [Saprospiraceae bacterium]